MLQDDALYEFAELAKTHSTELGLRTFFAAAGFALAWAVDGNWATVVGMALGFAGLVAFVTYIPFALQAYRHTKELVRLAATGRAPESPGVRTIRPGDRSGSLGVPTGQPVRRRKEEDAQD